MAIDSVSSNPVSPVPLTGTGSVERSPATPETSYIPPIKAALKTDATTNETTPKTNEKEVAKAIEAIEIMMEIRDRSVQFIKDDSSGADVIKVVDDSTGEVIRQMPSEELLGFMRNLTKMLGNFLDERV